MQLLKYKADLTFVEEFNYPALVKEHFEEILSHINDLKVESVILTGSTSRGELSYRATGERFIIYSDYEFLIVSKGKVDPADRDRLAKACQNLEENFSDSPLFHIDFSYIDRRSLRSSPHHLKHYETKENGITIYGRNLLHLMPNTTLKNLDFKDLNEILIWRLWAILLYLPNEFVRCGRVNSAKESMYKYILCRNLLDLTTWILPLKGVLLPSFRQRNTYLNSNFSELQDNQVISKRFLNLMNECMIGKFELKFSRSLVDLYKTAIEYFLRAKEYLLNVHYVSKDEGAGRRLAVETSSGKLFHDYHYRRKGYETLFFLKNFRDIGIKQGVRWVLTAKYGLMLEFLCNINMALVSSLSEDKEQKLCYLDRACSILKRLSAYNIFGAETKEFSESWLVLRRGFANFLMDDFRSLKMKKEYIDSVIE